MPIIECTIEREGPTVINDGGFTFKFEENERGHKVANVLSEGTAARLLSFKWFKLYKPEEDEAEEEEQEDFNPSVQKTEIDEWILQLRDEGQSLRAIGKQVGRSATYVSTVIKSAKQEA